MHILLTSVIFLIFSVQRNLILFMSLINGISILILNILGSYADMIFNVLGSPSCFYEKYLSSFISEYKNNIFLYANALRM